MYTRTHERAHTHAHTFCVVSGILQTSDIAALSSESTLVKQQVVELLSALCLFSRTGFQLVLHALHHFKVSFLQTSAGETFSFRHALTATTQDQFCNTQMDARQDFDRKGIEIIDFIQIVRKVIF